MAILLASLIFLRHGQAQNNVERRLVGRLPNVPLTAEGKAQAAYAAACVADMQVSRIYSSPIQRTMETAQIVAKHNSLEVIPDDRLTEIDMGGLTGKTYDDLMERYGNIFLHFYQGSDDFTNMGVETFASVRNRILDIVSYIQQKHAGENVLLVTHMDPIKAMLSTILNMTPQNLYRLIIANASLNIFLNSEGIFSVGGINVMEPSRLIKLW